MAAGDIAKEALLIVEKFDVDTGEDLSKGEIALHAGGAGIEQADAAVKGPFFVPLEDHDYSEVEEAGGDHEVKAAVRGFLWVKKAAGTAIPKGRWVEVSATAGAVTLWDYTTPGSFFEVVGKCMKDAASADTVCLILLGGM